MNVRTGEPICTAGLPRAIDFDAHVARNREIITGTSVLDEEPASEGFVLDVQLLRSLL